MFLTYWIVSIILTIVVVTVGAILNIRGHKGSKEEIENDTASILGAGLGLSIFGPIVVPLAIVILVGVGLHYLWTLIVVALARKSEAYEVNFSINKKEMD